MNTADPTSPLGVLLARYARENTKPISDRRRKAFVDAINAGTSEDALGKLCSCTEFARVPQVVLPAHHYEGLSRGRGWARKGRGDLAVWGERTDGGYRVGPGKWVVGGNDGFSRKGETDWVVEHIKVGGETWTVAF